MNYPTIHHITALDKLLKDKLVTHKEYQTIMNRITTAHVSEMSDKNG